MAAAVSEAQSMMKCCENYILIDAGANLTNKKFGRDLESVLQRAKDAGVQKMIVPGSSVKSSREALRLARIYPDTIYSTAGVHPHDAKSWTDECLSELRSVADCSECVAIGACGLDYNKDFSSPELQMEAFSKQIELACELKKPLYVHERDAHDDMVSMLSKYRDSLPPVFIHSFSGNAEQARTYVEMGVYVGITGVLCKDNSEKGLQSLLIDSGLPHAELLREGTLHPFLSKSIPQKLKMSAEDQHQDQLLGETADDAEMLRKMLLSSDSPRSNNSPSSSNSSRLPPAGAPLGAVPEAAPAAVAPAVAQQQAVVRPAALQPIPEETRLEFFQKLYTDIPIISNSLDLTCSIYKSVRRSNCISYRMLKTAERTADLVKNSNNPLVNIFRSPLMKIDYLLCATLDFVEDTVPAIKLTPTEIYENTKWMIKYVCTGRCALNCVCKTGMYSLNTANKLKNLMLCRPTVDDDAIRVVDFDESFERGVREILDNFNDPTSPYHQPIVPLMPDYRPNC